LLLHDGFLVDGTGRGDKVQYKVWIHLEELDELAKEYKNATEPICAGTFDTLDQAEALVERLTAGTAPAPPNQLLRLCKQVEQTLTTLGQNQGFGLMGPRCWQIIEELRKAIDEFERS
jgi:hypothetical protein